MAKDPAFLFYHHDFLIGTAFLTLEERGAYITLLSHMAAHKGSLTLKEVKVILGANFDPTELLKSKFKVDDSGNYFNTRLLEEIEKRKRFTQSRLDNLHKGIHMEDHKGVQMVNRNRDSNTIRTTIKTNSNINTKRSPRGLVRDNPPSLEEVKAYCLERKSNVDADQFYNKQVSIDWIDKNEIPYKDWKAVIRTWESYREATKTPLQQSKRPIFIVVVEMIAAGRTNHEIKHELIGKYIEKEIDEAIRTARDGKSAVSR